jgi:hypothetical protein
MRGSATNGRKKRVIRVNKLHEGTAQDRRVALAYTVFVARGGVFTLARTLVACTRVGVPAGTVVLTTRATDLRRGGVLSLAGWMRSLGLWVRTCRGSGWSLVLALWGSGLLGRWLQSPK